MNKYVKSLQAGSLLRIHRFRPVWVLALIALSISFFTRILLFGISAGGADWSASEIFGLIARGTLFDLSSTAYILVPMVLHLGLINETIYRKPWRWAFPGILIVLMSLVAFTNVIPVEFNKDIPKVVIAYIALRSAIFLFLGFKGREYRNAWRLRLVYTDLFLFTFLLLFNAASEYFFWDEFSTRYNFIAVDYLVYTNEVIGNIRESYPILPIIAFIGGAAAGIVYLVRHDIQPTFHVAPTLGQKTAYMFFFLSLPVLSFFGVNTAWKQFSQNEFANELAGNGLYDFGHAFRHNELEFERFYDTIPESEAFALTRSTLAEPNVLFTNHTPYSVEHTVVYDEPERKLNVVLISVESLSADFLGVFGNKKGLTPNLDTLAEKSLFFTRLYASGTRTVRGLEALSLSIPPPPGQSVIKRPNNKNMSTIGSVFRAKGYTTQYIYGGYGYFDNMSDFFNGNGYQVIDRTALKQEDIHYANIWGVADEDLFNLALRQLDSNDHAGKPFFSHIMTVSNHRPYTYPENRIDIPPSRQSRDGAVKYTDYAIGQFLKEASSKPWFRETVFIIVADHCASSSGKVQLPINGYHIPMMIYAPKYLEPAV
ncbi:MAG: sulfatase-like hydrolase/transferase, partial [Chitinophagaceae bacterium]|nr:sulfatase-like hydrolase/transferase [Chitinophagaceae bacterium]